MKIRASRRYVSDFHLFMFTFPWNGASQPAFGTPLGDFHHRYSVEPPTTKSYTARAQSHA